ncbi:hypothetical protein I6N96_01410 [Enterococcus sp. BWM-S5]|uniref:Uncharacterized protein n=1 Tax=Enterococcus larvae TaxID=2794352 RepID=A0ABS4CFZ0_9ENTE|nr:hypothetical protein [Enterococcus larvae]MBP1044920.1 hypothetical protein [Enterococcus larvae]
MEEFDWGNESEPCMKKPLQGCGYLFLLILILVGVGSIKVVDNVFNDPKEQILSQLPNFVDMPDYDRKDHFPNITEGDKISRSEMWYKIRIHASNQNEYLYLVKVLVSKKLFLHSEIKVTEVIED